MNPNQPVVQTVTQQSIYSNLFSSFNVSLSTVSVICLLQKTESTCRHLKRELSEEIHRAQINCCHGYSTSECTCVKTADLQVNAGTAGILRHLCAADKKQMNPEEISADLWWTTDADLASSLCCWFCWKPQCCSEGSKTWHKVQFQHPNRFPLSQNWDPTNSFKTSPSCGSTCRPACPQEGTVLVSVD